VRLADGFGLGRCDLFFLPEDLIEFEALDADLVALAEIVTYPHHARVSAFDPALQQDDVSGMELVAGRVQSRAGRRNVERADVGGASGR